MTQASLAIYEDEQEALRALVAEIGGFKVVGHAIRPDLPPDRAGSWLRDCLNVERAEKLAPSQLFHLLRLGRERGVHAPAEFINLNIGYRIAPVEPEDERAALQREFIATGRRMEQIATRIERLSTPPLSAIAGGRSP